MLRTSRLVAPSAELPLDHWHVPATATSGINLAKAIREELGKTPLFRAFLIVARGHGTFGPLRRAKVSFSPRVGKAKFAPLIRSIKWRSEMRQFCTRAIMSVALLALAASAAAQTVPVQLDPITTFIDEGTGQPNHAVQGPDGAFYAISTFSDSTTLSIFRIDPISKSHSVVAPLDTGQDFPSASRLVLAPDGRFYASFLADQGGGIVSFDPGTNAAAVIRQFEFDFETFMAGVDGAYPGPLTLGRDGRFYGAMSNSGPDGAGSLFTYHPWTDTFETLHQFSFDELDADGNPNEGGAFPFEALVEGADAGVFYGVNLDLATFCGNAFKFDSNTSTLTSLHTFDGGAEGCGPGALTVLPSGLLIGVTFSGGATSLGEPAFGGIFTLDPASGDVTALHMFAEVDGFSAIVPGNVTLTPGGRAYVLAQDFALGIARILRVNPETGAVETIQDLLGPSPEIGPLTVGSDARLYGIYNSSDMFALGVLDSIAVAPAGGAVGGTTTLSATLSALGMPLAGRTIAFALNGVAVGFGVTNDLGVATLDNVSLAGVAAGSFPTAVGASFAGDGLFPAADGTGLLNVLAVATPGLMLGDGYIADNMFRYEFKFLVLEKANGTDRGKLDLRIRNLDNRKRNAKRDDRFVSTSYTDVVFNFDQADRPSFDTAVFKGTGKLNGVTGYRFEAFAEDRVGRLWRGKHQETFRIVIYSPTNEVVASVEGTVKGGFLLSKRLRK